MKSRDEQDRSHTTSIVFGVLLLLVVSLVVHWLTSASSAPPIWDEKYALPIIERIVENGWTVDSVIDYDDTKGPTFFVIYAAAGEVVGVSPGALRFVSITLFVLGGGLLVYGALLAGVDRRGCLLTTAVYATLPYGMVLSQLVMSEAGFVSGSILTALVFAWTVGTPVGRQRETLGLIWYAIVLSVLLHYRVHAVALGAGVCFTAIWVCGRRCLWWWGATVIAGLSRVPLMVHWGGLVGASFQDRYGLGFRLESLTYLAAALVPTIGVFLVHGMLDHGDGRRTRLWWMSVGGVAGVLLAVLATPGFSSDPEDLKYAGIVATALRRFGDQRSLLAVLFTVPCAVGGASLAVLAHLAWERRYERCFGNVIAGMAVWTLIAGWGLYALTRGDVYDRYLLAFSFSLPLVLVLRVRPWLVVVQLLLQLLLAAYQVFSDLGPN